MILRVSSAVVKVPLTELQQSKGGDGLLGYILFSGKHGL